MNLPFFDVIFPNTKAVFQYIQSLVNDNDNDDDDGM